MKKTVGIIGGMGPMATADLFKKIIENTPAKKDQDHIRVLIDSNTEIPDRTAALLSGGASPIPALTDSVHRLVTAGADCLIMPCNTAHGFYDAVQEAAGSVPVLHMIRLTGEELKRRGISKVGLLATSGTVQTGIYGRNLEGIEILTPNSEEQEAVMDLIYGAVKAGLTEYDASKVQKTADRLLKEGAQAIILGCTELPLAKELYHLDFPSVDPTLCLAQGAVAFALKEA